MYDILCDIWKHPENAFSPMPLYVLNADADQVATDVSELHKRGVDGITLTPDEADSTFTEDSFSRVGALLEASRRRFMSVILSDCGASSRDFIRETKELSARRLYAIPARTEIPENELRLFRVSVSFDEKGRLTETRLSPAEGFVEYDLVLGYSYESSRPDYLSPYTAESITGKLLSAYHERFSEYFGSTVIGFVADTPRFAEGEIPWTYDFAEDFFSSDGDMHTLMSLFFEPREKKYRREGEFSMRKALSARLSAVYYAPLAEWCEKHGIALMSSPADAKDSTPYAICDVSGAALSPEKIARGAQLTSPDSVGVKLAADCARHRGLARSYVRLTGTDELSPDSLMKNLNFAFARGCSMVLPDSLRLHEDEDGVEKSTVRADYKKLSSYIKRMTWLGSAGTNNPEAAVLCTPDYVPYTPVRALYEAGYSWNYLTLDDLMTRAKVQDGKFVIDRYEYGIILIDSRLRLDAASVTKIGRFVTEGGLMYRGGDFASFMEKHARRTTYFKSDSVDIRFTHVTKSGVDFFIMINEGDAAVRGSLVTDISSMASHFDAMTGGITPISCTIADGGFSYPVEVAAHSSYVVGFDSGKLPVIEDEKKCTLLEIASLSENRTTFDYKTNLYNRAVLSFTCVAEAVDVRVGGCDVCRMMFKPYEVDITEHLTDGENSLELIGDFTGACVKMYKVE